MRKHSTEEAGEGLAILFLACRLVVAVKGLMRHRDGGEDQEVPVRRILGRD
jgi:hypothetical protein